MSWRAGGQLAKTWQALSPSDPDDDSGMEVDDQMPTGAAEDSENELVGQPKASRMVQSTILGLRSR